jgi:hypothetical protein
MLSVYAFTTYRVALRAHRQNKGRKTHRKNTCCLQILYGIGKQRLKTVSDHFKRQRAASFKKQSSPPLNEHFSP